MQPGGATGMKKTRLSFVPLGKGDAAHFAAGGPNGTHTSANEPSLPGGDFQERLKDTTFMAKALVQARRALELNEVPIGAVVVVDGTIVGRGCNKSIRQADPTAHAEILALRQAARRLGNYRLTSATLYCTLEPCSMCAGALIWARLARLVYAAKDPKAGAIDSHLRLAQAGFSNHRFEVVSGVMEEEAAALLRQFFQARRRRA